MPPGSVPLNRYQFIRPIGPRYQQRIEPRRFPLKPPVKVRPGGAAGHADQAERLPLTDMVADRHVDPREMQKRAGQPMPWSIISRLPSSVNE